MLHDPDPLFLLLKVPPWLLLISCIPSKKNNKKQLKTTQHSSIQSIGFPTNHPPTFEFSSETLNQIRIQTAALHGESANCSATVQVTTGSTVCFCFSLDLHCQSCVFCCQLFCFSFEVWQLRQNQAWN